MATTTTHTDARPAKLMLASHALCPYVQRVAIVLAEKGVPFERREVDLADKPAWFQTISPLGKTPVLLVGDELLEAFFSGEVIDLQTMLFATVIVVIVGLGRRAPGFPPMAVWCRPQPWKLTNRPLPGNPCRSARQPASYATPNHPWQNAQIWHS